MRGEIDRRALLRMAGGTAGILGLAGCQTSDNLRSLISEPMRSVHGIDPHCHIFNGQDIPVVSFLNDVVLPEYLPKKSWLEREFLFPELAYIAHGIEVHAASFDQEMEALAAIEADPDREFSHQYDFPQFDKIDQAARARWHARQAMGIRDNTPEYNWFDMNVMVPLVRLLDKDQAYTDWIRILSGYRFRILRELSNLFAGSDVRFDLYSPAMVDLDFWLAENSLPMSQQAELISRLSLLRGCDFLMNGLIAYDPLRAALVDEMLSLGIGKGVLVRPLDVVKKAVTEQGFLGVKLYPPMGFYPIGNADLDEKNGFELIRDGLWDFIKTDAEEHLAGEPRPPATYGKKRAILHATTATGARRHNVLKGISQDQFNKFFAMLGRRLDWALVELYDWCIDHDVPIMAHCANSQGSHIDPAHPESLDNYALRSNPEGWRKVLEMSDGRYRSLRLNLGHGGGIWFLPDVATNTYPNTDAGKRAYVSRDWVATMLDMVANPNYPNLHADFSDWQETKLTPAQALACPDGTSIDTAFHYLSHDLGAKKDLWLKKIMFGTDWTLMGDMDNVPGYLVGLVGRMDCTFRHHAITADFFRNNAIRFYDLANKSGRIRQRLEQFYASRESYLAKLHEFDGVA